MKELKVKEVLSGLDSIELKANNRPHRFIPMIVEEEIKVYQRTQVIKHFETFKKEKGNNYTQKYMSTIYGLLFKNEKKYYIKRNKMNIDLPESSKDDQDNYDDDLVPIRLPLTQPNKSNKEIKMRIPTIIKHDTYPQSSNALNRLSNERSSFTPKKNQVNMYTRGRGGKFFNLSVEKSRLLEMIHSSDEFFKQKAMTKQEQLIRRIKVHGLNPNLKQSPQKIKYNNTQGPTFNYNYSLNHNSLPSYTPATTTNNAFNKKLKVIKWNKLSKKVHSKPQVIQ